MKFRVSSFGFRVSRRGFSLIEVLLAVFILGIGLIMVISVFPVGADWTRQTTEDSVAQTIALDGMSVVKTYYRPGGPILGGGNLLSLLNGTPFVLQPLPGFFNIPANQRAYQFGSANPFPAITPTNCTYFWTALVRLNLIHQNATIPSATYDYDVYILVFKKGDKINTFGSIGSGTQIIGTRGNTETYIPDLYLSSLNSGSYNSSTGLVTNAVPPGGAFGIGASSGTVFRQIIDIGTGTPSAVPRPLPVSGESVIYAPCADNGDLNTSPLIYVYQTTLTQ